MNPRVASAVLWLLTKRGVSHFLIALQVNTHKYSVVYSGSFIILPQASAKGVVDQHGVSKQMLAVTWIPACAYWVRISLVINTKPLALRFVGDMRLNAPYLRLA